MNFFSWLRKTFGSAVTEADNKTHSVVKHGGWIGVVAVLAHDAYQLFHPVAGYPPVSVKDFAFALSAILASVGIGVGIGKPGEHKDEPEKGGA